MSLVIHAFSCRAGLVVRNSLMRLAASALLSSNTITIVSSTSCTSKTRASRSRSTFFWNRARKGVYAKSHRSSVFRSILDRNVLAVRDDNQLAWWGEVEPKAPGAHDVELAA